MSNYNEESMYDLAFPDNARQKVGMYLGTAELHGFLHTIDEIRDNSLDEIRAGYGDTLIVNYNLERQSISISDNGRGIPFGVNSKGEDSLVKALTTLHYGGKHNNSVGDSAYKFSSGINGVGGSVVNATSKYFRVRSIRGNKKAEIVFADGVQTYYAITDNTVDRPSGTAVEWVPSVKENDFDRDNVFLPNCLFTKENIEQKFRYVPYLNPGIKVYINGEALPVVDKVEEILGVDRLLTTTFSKTASLSYMKNKKVVWWLEADKELGKAANLQLVMNFSSNPVQLKFVNGIELPQGGTHDMHSKDNC